MPNPLIEGELGVFHAGSPSLQAVIYKKRKPIISHIIPGILMAEEKKSQAGVPLPPTIPAAPSPPRKQTRPLLQEEGSQEGPYPPLFIKIDKYKDIIQNLQRLKTYSLSLRDALDALNDIEKELKTGIELTQRAVDDFNSIIAMLDAKLIRLAGGEEGEFEGQVPEHMDDYIKGVYEQISKIRDELRTISS
jgi:hypothetical protein